MRTFVIPLYSLFALKLLLRSVDHDQVFRLANAMLYKQTLLCLTALDDTCPESKEKDAFNGSTENGF
jgi:hypothetical protein